VAELNRRRFVLAAVATAAFAGISRFSVGASEETIAQAGVAAPIPPPAPPPPPPLLPPPDPGMRIALPGGGDLSQIPGDGDLLAMTVDDGVNSDVVRAYTQLAKDTGIRLTFFVNGTYKSWTDNLDLLRPLVESGQIQLGNHTFSHPDLTTLTQTQVADQLQRNHDFLKTTFGVDATPYYRPPYGSHNAAVDAVAADLGYGVPTLWNGSLGDSEILTEDYIVKMAAQYFTPQTIVIGHLNHLPVTHVYPQLVDLIRSRNLRTVTLNDVFLAPEVSYVVSP
jgi:peptidoglycan/xylan/chitin deacetylase (PgdA/CDA1 family)